MKVGYPHMTPALFAKNAFGLNRSRLRRKQ